MSPLPSQERADAVAVHGALGAAQLEVKALKAELAGECAHTALSLIYRQERDDALAEVVRLNRAITRVLVLIAPETQMAQPLYGDRYFDESDIRAALEEPSS